MARMVPNASTSLAIRAVEIAGHETVLAGFLGLQTSEVRHWVFGQSDPAPLVLDQLRRIIAVGALNTSR